MDLLQQRDFRNKDQLLQERFIQRILSEEAENIKIEQSKAMRSRGFSQEDWYADRAYKVNDTVLQFEHLKKHRFVDMKTRVTKQGVKKKVSHPIHNRIIFGHANNIVRRLSFEYTDRMKKTLAQEFNIEL